VRCSALFPDPQPRIATVRRPLGAKPDPDTYTHPPGWAHAGVTRSFADPAIASVRLAENMPARMTIKLHIHKRVTSHLRLSFRNSTGRTPFLTHSTQQLKYVYAEAFQSGYRASLKERTGRSWLSAHQAKRVDGAAPSFASVILLGKRAPEHAQHDGEPR
jgi:hypothetical protein